MKTSTPKQAAPSPPAAISAQKLADPKPPVTTKPVASSSLWAPRPRTPSLVFAPLAWLKLRHFLHSDDVEIGGFGISSSSDLLYVEQFLTVRQKVGLASVEFDDAAVADYFDDCVDRGISPGRCGRIWLHTHPGSSASPSSTDESTFARVFGNCDWSIMAIVARGGETYCRLSFNAGPGGQVQIPLVVDWERLPKDLLSHEGGLDELVSGWFDEYGRNIMPEPEPLWQGNGSRMQVPSHLDGLHDLDDLEELEEAQELKELQGLQGLEELSNRQVINGIHQDEWDQLFEYLEDQEVLP